MILALHIDKDEPGHYTARVLDCRVEVDEFAASTIAAAIREAAVRGYDAKGFHIWYGHVCIGTTSAYAMRHDGETLALRLVRLHAEF